MPCTLVVGTQWGDEGKGKVIDLLSGEADVVVRYQGGANAGHTVEIGGKQFILHLVPSGILRPGKINVVGNGVVVDLQDLVAEIDGLEEKGIDIKGRLFISDLAHVTLPYHKRMDEAHEAKRGAGKIGTTHRGIGPTYGDKSARVGIKMGDLLDEPALVAKVRRNLEEKNFLFKNYYHVPEVNEEEVLSMCRKAVPRLGPLVTDTLPLLHGFLAENKKILLEGGQGTLLDVDFGTYPYVTSSNPTAGGACAGTGLPPSAITGSVGVAKAYTTRVGAGPLPTKLPPQQDEQLRVMGREYGATTGRPRSCGWFDSLVVRRAARINGLTQLAITKLDVLDQLKTIKACVAYRYRGKELTEFPNRIEVLEECEPVYREFPGWQKETRAARNWNDLPANARAYVEAIGEMAGAKIGLVSVGAGREDTIVMGRGI